MTMVKTKDGGYLDYQDMMAEVGGKPVDKAERARRFAEHGITTRDFSWDGKDNSGYATVVFQHWNPVHIMWYIWDITDENLMLGLEQDLGVKAEMRNWGRQWAL